jgi:hypothetical protein
MTIFLLLCLLLLCLAILMEGLIQGVRINQFPFLAALVFLGFIVFPLFGLLNTKYLPAWSLERYLIMSILSVIAIYCGDYLARRKQVEVLKFIQYDRNKWLFASWLLVVIGSIAYLKYRSLFQSGSDVLTGGMVAVNFVVVLIRYGFVMVMLLFLWTKSRYALLLIILCGFYYFDRIVLSGRRQVMIEFVFVIMGSLWFTKGKLIPRPFIVSGFILFILLNYSMGIYRNIVVTRSDRPDWSKLKDVDWTAGARDAFSEGSPEITTGIYYMAGVSEEMAFDFGLSHWNTLVFNFVPAQIFGSEFKNSLCVPISDPSFLAEKYFSYTKSSGSTVTGMGDCYNSFWYFGVMKFFVIAYIMQMIFRHSCLGSIKAQVLYLYMMTMALHTITHGTGWFLSPWIHLLIFWFPLIYWAKLKKKTNVPRSMNGTFLQAASVS